MSTHISGTCIPATDPRTDTELADQLRQAMTDWLHGRRDAEIGQRIHQDALASELKGTGPTPVETFIAEWTKEATSLSRLAQDRASAVLIRTANGTRYLTFHGLGGMFAELTDGGRFGTDFSFHNSTDEQLEHLTEQQWSLRRNTWEQLIPTGVFADAGTVVEAGLDPERQITPVVYRDDLRDSRASALAVSWAEYPRRRTTPST